jgi:hypothetical protein
MNNFEDQLDKIRLELYEETKDMAKQDAINHVNDTAKRIAVKYGIKIIKEPDFAVKNPRPEGRSIKIYP